MLHAASGRFSFLEQRLEPLPDPDISMPSHKQNTWRRLRSHSHSGFTPFSMAGSQGGITRASDCSMGFGRKLGEECLFQSTSASSAIPVMAAPENRDSDADDWPDTDSEFYYGQIDPLAYDGDNEPQCPLTGLATWISSDADADSCMDAASAPHEFYEQAIGRQKVQLAMAGDITCHQGKSAVVGLPLVAPPRPPPPCNVPLGYSRDSAGVNIDPPEEEEEEFRGRGVHNGTQEGGAPPDLEVEVTMMIKNLPPNCSQQELLEQINQSGFSGCYNFGYLPCNFSSGQAHGFAFVNFTSASAARDFRQAWHDRRWFYSSPVPRFGPRLAVSPADVQGLQANLKRWGCSRLRRIRNPNLRPFVLETCSDTTAASATTFSLSEAPAAISLPVQATAALEQEMGSFPKTLRLSDHLLPQQQDQGLERRYPTLLAGRSQDGGFKAMLPAAAVKRQPMVPLGGSPISCSSARTTPAGMAVCRRSTSLQN
ncbi:unnamed protein product [Polarella glacialis]|uniref:RRM domain-containing protein n=1 Tax=Polarella glacialis TaxID=89957 RepID=A0A813H5L9_POLGL|nr:unnamed protein product [Polarella glacialis]